MISDGACPLAEDLSAWIDGELPVAERRGVQEHLDGCAECRASVARLEAAASLIRSLPRESASDELVASVAKHASRAGRASRTFRPAWLLAASALLGSVLLYRMVERERPSSSLALRDARPLSAVRPDAAPPSEPPAAPAPSPGLAAPADDGDGHAMKLRDEAMLPARARARGDAAANAPSASASSTAGKPAPPATPPLGIADERQQLRLNQPAPEAQLAAKTLATGEDSKRANERVLAKQAKKDASLDALERSAAGRDAPVAAAAPAPLRAEPPPMSEATDAAAGFRAKAEGPPPPVAEGGESKPQETAASLSKEKDSANVGAVASAPYPTDADRAMLVPPAASLPSPREQESVHHAGCTGSRAPLSVGGSGARLPEGLTLPPWVTHLPLAGAITPEIGGPPLAAHFTIDERGRIDSIRVAAEARPGSALAAAIAAAPAVPARCQGRPVAVIVSAWYVARDSRSWTGSLQEPSSR